MTTPKLYSIEYLILCILNYFEQLILNIYDYFLFILVILSIITFNLKNINAISGNKESKKGEIFK
jgi:hypothetical protein